MKLLFNEVPQDAASVSETEFRAYPGGALVDELSGEADAIESLFRKTAPRQKIEDVIKGVQVPPRALCASIRFEVGEDDDDLFLRRIMDRWEAEFLGGFVRHEHYEVAWTLLRMPEAGHELRAFVPLWDKREQKPLVLPKGCMDRAAIWTKVQALTFGLVDPYGSGRDGERPDFSRQESLKKPLRAALVDHIEEAVFAGDLRSRDDVIADLERLGFHVVHADGRSLSVKYDGENETIQRKARRPLELSGPVFSAGFGSGKDPRARDLEVTIAEGLHRLREEVANLTAAAEAGLGDRVSASVRQEVGSALAKAQNGLDERRNDFEQEVAKFAERAVAGVQDRAGDVLREVSTARDGLQGSLTEYVRRLDAVNEAKAEEAKAALSDAYQVVLKLNADLKAAKDVLDRQLTSQARTINRMRYGLLGGAALAAVLALCTGWFIWRGGAQVVGYRSAMADLAAAEERLAGVVASGQRQIEVHDAELGRAQAALQSVVQNLSVLGDAVRIEKKADGTNALTIYSRRLPSVPKCEQDPNCVARVDLQRR